MATPHVAGVAALVWARAPSLTYEEVRARIFAGADPIPAMTGRAVTGGRLNAANALAGLGIGSDSAAPLAIADLETANVTHRQVVLTWTATGDDGTSGQAALYDLRYDTAPLTEESWMRLSVSTGSRCRQRRAAETFTVDRLDQGTEYFFALRVMDDAGNYSPISNVVSATTTALTPATLEIGRATDRWDLRRELARPAERRRQGCRRNRRLGRSGRLRHRRGRPRRLHHAGDGLHRSGRRRHRRADPRGGGAAHRGSVAPRRGQRPGPGERRVRGRGTPRDRAASGVAHRRERLSSPSGSTATPGSYVGIIGVTGGDADGDGRDELLVSVQRASKAVSTC